MKKQFRLLKSEDFSSVIKTGYTIKNSSFVVHYKQNNLTNIRVGITASTKLGNAVVRSTVRRKIRAICDECITNWQSSTDVVIIAKFEFLSKTYTENVTLLNELLKTIPDLNNEKKN